MNLIQLVVLDMAGTTVHDEQFVQKVLQEAFAKHQLAISLQEASQVMGIPKPVAIRQLLQQIGFDAQQISPQLVEAIHQDFVKAMILFYEESPLVREKKGASELFQALKASGIKVVLDTGFDRATADAIIRRLGWQKLIDFSVTSDEVERGRPYPDLIYRAMALAGVEDAAAVAKVGDTASDLQQGYAAGCRLVVGVTGGAYSREELAQEMHTHLIDGLEELLPILGLPKTHFQKPKAALT